MKRRAAVGARVLRVACAVGLCAAQVSRAHAQPSTVQPGDGTSEPPVRMGVRMMPETVTVGAPFTVRVRVALPSAWRVLQPPTPDTGGIVEPLDPPRLRDTVRGPDRVVDMTWRFLAWEPGAHPLPIASLRLASGSRERALTVPGAIVVRSVLPADTALRTPRPARAPFAVPITWWPRVLTGLGVLAALALAVWLARCAWRARRSTRERVRTPREVADEAFERLAARGLPAAGESRRHVALVGEIVRDFLAARLGLPTSLATGEALAVAGPAVGALAEPLAELLGRIDVARFATTPVTREEAERLDGQARRMIAMLDERARSPHATPLAVERIA